MKNMLSVLYESVNPVVKAISSKTHTTDSFNFTRKIYGLYSLKVSNSIHSDMQSILKKMV